MPTCKALVFDIQRFAIHDGSGLRTTVFFKGCPLRCKWCQNPEGMEWGVRPVWLEKECIHCRHCLQAARPGQLQFTTRPLFLQPWSDGSNLIDACPAGTIVSNANWWSVEDLAAEVQKDAVFFRDQGGLTLSGGEPFFQPEAVQALLKAAKARGLHTAIETSFYADWAVIEPVLEDLDEIFVDCKLFNEARHQAMTGVSNARILANLKALLESEHWQKVTIRTPLIPGCTDDAANIQEIAAFLSSIQPKVRYELLNYNILAPAKYPLSEKEWPLDPHLRPLSKEQLQMLGQTARDQGLEQVILPE